MEEIFVQTPKPGKRLRNRQLGANVANVCITISALPDYLKNNSQIKKKQRNNKVIIHQLSSCKNVGINLHFKTLYPFMSMGFSFYAYNNNNNNNRQQPIEASRQATYYTKPWVIKWRLAAVV